jgi:DNA-directed RNA polymerase subunit E'/Rpb7
MQFITIQKRICLPSKYLDQNLMDHLLSKITELTYGNCTKEYGYILKIIKINDIISHEISRANTDNIFNVDFDVEILKPEKGLEVEGVVCMVYKDGIFINILDKQKMLIPKSNLQKYEFNDDLKIYEDEDGKTIKINDTVKAVISAVSYSNQKYSCFGTIN